MQSRRRLLCIRKMKLKQNNGGCNQGLHPPLFFYALLSHRENAVKYLLPDSAKYYTNRL